MSPFPALARSVRSMVLLCIIDWKTATSRYPEVPLGVLSLDSQMISFLGGGFPEGRCCGFRAKARAEILYLEASISEEQRQDYGRLVGETVNQIVAAHFTPRSGIRYPQNPA
jgi:hypothetical protein